ncbi:MAG: HU family DNA-binding protein [Planctomycetes bacterium]|nr:HU family DNA-binding protein [Planctomycetota bacterium]
MNKAELIEWIQKTGEVGETKAAAERAVTAVLKGIEHGLLKKKRVNIVGFGSFAVRNRGPRMGRNPRTGEPMKIPAQKTVAFKAGGALKGKLK